MDKTTEQFNKEVSKIKGDFDPKSFKTARGIKRELWNKFSKMGKQELLNWSYHARQKENRQLMSLVNHFLIPKLFASK